MAESREFYKVTTDTSTREILAFDANHAVEEIEFWFPGETVLAVSKREGL